MEKTTTFRTLRPFLWSFLFILILFAIRGHQYLTARTSVSFDVTLEGRPAGRDTSAELDGVRVWSPTQLAVGIHWLTISHPKGRSLTTNLFVFYGTHPLGTINLKRATGNFDVSFDPSPQLFSITGEEFRTNLNGIAHCAFSLPTGDYQIEARFLHHTEKQPISIKDSETKTLRIVPNIGAIDIHANVSDAVVRVMGENETEFLNGALPTLVAELPLGEYRILASHHGHTWEGSSKVTMGATNKINIDFVYGAVSIETKPPGADIVGEDGRSWGKTPLVISEVQPGQKNIAMRLDGFEPVNATFEVKAGETNVMSRRLVRSAFAQAMRKGNEALSSGAYELAIQSFEAALAVEPDDSDARTLLASAKRVRALDRATKFGNAFDFKAAIAELEPLLAAFPNDGDAKPMLEKFRELDKARMAADEEARSNRAKSSYKSIIDSIPDSELFERHELVTKMPLREAEAAIVRALRSDPPFKGIQNSSPPDVFRIVGEQEFMTILQTSAGKRRVTIAGAEIKKGETRVQFQVME